LSISIYFTSGILLAAVGLLGVYIGKVFNEAKARPIYIIESETNEK
jgi:dolichol-phosphate mannosyltransferase